MLCLVTSSTVFRDGTEIPRPIRLTDEDSENVTFARLEELGDTESEPEQASG